MANVLDFDGVPQCMSRLSDSPSLLSFRGQSCGTGIRIARASAFMIFTQSLWDILSSQGDSPGPSIALQSSFC